MHASTLLATSRSSEGTTYYLYTPLRFPRRVSGLQAEGMSSRTSHSARRFHFVAPPLNSNRPLTRTHSQHTRFGIRSIRSPLFNIIHSTSSTTYDLFVFSFCLSPSFYSCLVSRPRSFIHPPGRKTHGKINCETNTEFPPILVYIHQ